MRINELEKKFKGGYTDSLIKKLKKEIETVRNNFDAEQKNYGRNIDDKIRFLILKEREIDNLKYMIRYLLDIVIKNGNKGE